MSAEFTARIYKTNHAGPARFIWSHILRHKFIAVGMIIGAFSNAALAVAIPALAGVAFDALIAGEGLPVVGAAVLGIVASQILRGVLQLMRNFSSESYGQLMERDIRDELYASLLGKSMAYHDSQPTGEIMARVTNDVREISLMMNPGVNLIVGSGMFLIVPVLFTPTIYPALVVTPLVFVILHVIIQVRFVRTLHPIAQNVRASFGQMNARLAESLDGLQVVKGAAQEKQEAALFARLTDKVRDYFVEQGNVEARYLSLLFFSLALVFGFVHSVILYQAGLISTGDIVAFNGTIALFGFPVTTSLFSLSQFALGYASAARILSVIVAETDIDQNTQGHKATVEGAIRFEHVDFGYLPNKRVLHDISFEVSAGETVALVGQTGAGKTTVTKLINRMYDAANGTVYIDGVDVRDWNMQALRSQISIIEQDIFLFSRTIAENIAFGKPDVPVEAIIDAAKKAQAHDFIMSFPDGYETIIGQRGVTLSGGQRQRIAIARAFLTNPPILVLDDSTSAIDSATEDLIQRAIWAASEGRTTILITHRLSQIRWADKIVVLKNGRVVAQGAHHDLLQSSEDYRRIFARYEAPPQREAAIAAQ